MTRVLIAEASPAVGASCRRFLSGCGCEVETAANGAECVERLGRFLPDVLVLALGLPSGGAGRVLSWLHRVEARHPVPAVVLTGRASSQNLSEIILTAPVVEAYFQDPLGLPVLVEVIRSAAAAAGRGKRQGQARNEPGATMGCTDKTDGYNCQRAPEDEGVELPLLVPGWQHAALELVAAAHGLTIGQLLRRLIATYLSSAAGRGPSDEAHHAGHSDGR
jgi:CheY-like chemotaxis protein